MRPIWPCHRRTAVTTNTINSGWVSTRRQAAPAQCCNAHMHTQASILHQSNIKHSHTCILHQAQNTHNKQFYETELFWFWPLNNSSVPWNVSRITTHKKKKKKTMDETNDWDKKIIYLFNAFITWLSWILDSNRPIVTFYSQIFFDH